MYREELAKVFDVESAPFTLPPIIKLVRTKLPVELPKPTSCLPDLLEVLELNVSPAPALSAAVASRKEERRTKSVKVCGIEVNSIEAAAVPRVLVSISFIV
jgi:hypothetical protein